MTEEKFTQKSRRNIWRKQGERTGTLPISHVQIANPSEQSIFLNLHLLALDRSNNLPSMFARSEFQIPYSLPCTCVQLSIRDGDRNTCSDQRWFDMCLQWLAPVSYNLAIPLCSNIEKQSDKEKEYKPACHLILPHCVYTTLPFYLLAQSYPTHHSYQPWHLHPSSHSN